jgi:predicted AlkP superfamily phosphohydrolase/phosphomutase
MLKNIWKQQGAFLTLGWPQDTTALEEGFINDAQFLSLCDDIFRQRERIFLSMLSDYKEGIFGCIFDSLDRVQHMFWKNRPDVIESWYLKLDALAGKIDENLKSKNGSQKINLLFVSDHGFQDYDFKVNLNRWLIDHDFIKLKDGERKKDLTAIDWCKSQAYAIGLNSIYLNIIGREREGMIPLAEKEQVLNKLSEKLIQWKGPDGRPVIQNLYRNEETFSGPLAVYGPDLVVGYSSKYRASSETGLGGWKEVNIEKNSDHWEADHCIDAREVPGVIFSRRSLDSFSSPSFRDIPAITIGRELKPRKSAVPVESDEDQDVLEERLKGLGYL